MPTAEQVVRLALDQTGDRYVLGAEASPLNPNPSTFDCSELVEWVCARLGVQPKMPDLVVNQAAHCRRMGTAISVETAIRTRGALLFNDFGWSGSGGSGNHVAISLGDGTTIEARGSRYGVGSWSASGRRWNMGALIPGVDYSQRPPLINPPTPPTEDDMAYRDITMTTDGDGNGYVDVPIPFAQALAATPVIGYPRDVAAALPGLQYVAPGEVSLAPLADPRFTAVVVSRYLPGSPVTVRLAYRAA